MTSRGPADGVGLDARVVGGFCDFGVAAEQFVRALADRQSVETVSGDPLGDEVQRERYLYVHRVRACGGASDLGDGPFDGVVGEFDHADLGPQQSAADRAASMSWLSGNPATYSGASSRAASSAESTPPEKAIARESVSTASMLVSTVSPTVSIAAHGLRTGPRRERPPRLGPAPLDLAGGNAAGRPAPSGRGSTSGVKPRLVRNGTLHEQRVPSENVADERSVKFAREAASTRERVVACEGVGDGVRIGSLHHVGAPRCRS